MSLKSKFKFGHTVKKAKEFANLIQTLVTQPILQRQPNPTELRLMDFSLLRRDGGGTFGLHFWNLHKIWI